MSRKMLKPYRIISTEMWRDSYFLDLSPNEKLFFIYLLTNESTTQCGIYELPLSHASMETKLSQEEILVILNKFSRDKKIVYSIDTREVAIINWNKYNANMSPYTMQRVADELKNVKNPELVLYLYDPREPLYNDMVKRKGNEVHVHIENPWAEYFQDITDNDILEFRMSIKVNTSKNRPPTGGIEAPYTQPSPYTDTDTDTNSYTESDTDTNADNTTNGKKVSKTNSNSSPPARSSSNKLALADEDKDLYHKIENAFLSKNDTFSNWKKEGEAIKRLIKYCKQQFPDDVENGARQMMRQFWELRKTGDTFWAGQPFIPSALSSGGIWDRVLEQFREDEIPEELREYYAEKGVNIDEY